MFLRKRRTLFVLIFVALLTASAGGCQTADPVHDDEDAGGAGDADADTDVDTESDSDDCTSYTVASPAPGVAATAEEICAPSSVTVVSNGAAIVSLQLNIEDPEIATGMAAVPNSVLERVIGLPQIRIIDATTDALLSGTVSAIAETDEGYSFAVTWPSGAFPWEAGDTSLSFEVVLEVFCGEGVTPDAGEAAGTKLVSSITYTDLCTDAENGFYEWVSSGGECVVCENMTDPMDLPPTASRAPDGVALASSIDLEIVPVLSFGRSLVLVAETHGYGRPLTYSWSASAGTLSAREEGGVVWDLPKGQGPHLVQVVADDGDSAAVAAFTFEHRL
jgi:hypothetical protein